MERIFVPLYRFFEKHKVLMYALLIVSAAVFVWFGLKVSYEEDISKLLPSSSESNDTGLAFGSIKVKDKIFLQFQPSASASQEDLMSVCDEFFDSLAVRDSATRYIDNVLYRIDDDFLVNALDYVMGHVPSFVDTSCYDMFDRSMSPEEAFPQMAENLDLLNNDMTGSATTMVCTDPFNLRSDVASALDASRGRISGYSIIDGHIFSRDSTVELGFISPDFSSFDSGTGTHLVGILEGQISEFKTSHPEVRILMHGAPVRSANNSRCIKSDLLLTIGGSFILILLFLCIAFKSFSIIVFMALPVAYGAFFALSIIYWMKGSMSLMALGIGAIVLGVALSYCLHVLTHYKYVQDAEQMLKDESTPVCLGCLTTIGAFMGLLFTESDLLRDFGLFATLALVGSTLFALIILPHFLAARSRVKVERCNEHIFNAIDRMDSYPLDRKLWLIIPISAICVFCFFAASHVEFDSDLTHLGYNPPELLESERLFADKNYEGNSQVYYAALGSSLDEALVANDRILSVLVSLHDAGVVSQYARAVDLLFPTTDEQERRIAAWNSYWTPEKVAQARDMLDKAARSAGIDSGSFGLFFDMIGSGYEPGSLYDSGIIPEGLRCNLIEQASDGRFLVFTPAMMPQSEKRNVSDAVNAVPNSLVVDPFYYTTDMVEIVHNDFSKVLAISSIFVLVVLLFSFRNVWVALLAFLPMFLSWFVVEGVMAVLGMRFNLINIVISTFIFGIGVDYSIFIMKGLLEEARTGGSSLLLWHKSAIFFSAFVLLVVTVALMFARHPAISSIGISTFIGMASTIIISYVLQPFLFRTMLKSAYFRRSFKIDSNDKK